MWKVSCSLLRFYFLPTHIVSLSCSHVFVIFMSFSLRGRKIVRWKARTHLSENDWIEEFGIHCEFATSTPNFIRPVLNFVKSTSNWNVVFHSLSRRLFLEHSSNRFTSLILRLFVRFSSPISSSFISTPIKEREKMLNKKCLMEICWILHTFAFVFLRQALMLLSMSDIIILDLSLDHLGEHFSLFLTLAFYQLFQVHRKCSLNSD